MLWMIWIKRCCFFLLLIMKSAFAIEVAITVDDLPYVGDYEKNPTADKLKTVQLMLDEVLTQYEKVGVQFISLPDALADPVYAINADTVSDTGYTFLNEIRRSRHLQNPPTVTKFYDSIPENQLSTLCVENEK